MEKVLLPWAVKHCSELGMKKEQGDPGCLQKPLHYGCFGQDEG